MTFLPDQDIYYIVSWENGVTSVHRTQDDAGTHIARLRDEDKTMYMHSRESAQMWKDTRAKIIMVKYLSEILT